MIALLVLVAVFITANTIAIWAINRDNKKAVERSNEFWERHFS